jgi:Shedu protein SduA, C-terminal
VLLLKKDAASLQYEDLDLAPFAPEHGLDETALAKCWNSVSHGALSKKEYEFASRLFGSDNFYSSFEEARHQWTTLHPLGMMFGAPEILARRYLNQLLAAQTRNSLLHEFAIQMVGERSLVLPYHSHAVNEVAVDEEVWLAKPAVFAGQIRAAFEGELRSLELLVRRNAREEDIQQWLERHPEVFHALGYAKIFPKVVLQRADGGNLIPDFILQPCDDVWCDVLDIKRPEPNIVAGPSDRKRFSAAVAELQAQLREYAAYFENPKLAQAVEKKYGIKCYKPKLIGVIGKEIPANDSPEMRRLMTSYSDAEILSFDKLIARSRSRLLI